MLGCGENYGDIHIQIDFPRGHSGSYIAENCLDTSLQSLVWSSRPVNFLFEDIPIYSWVVSKPLCQITLVLYGLDNTRCHLCLTKFKYLQFPTTTCRRKRIYFGNQRLAPKAVCNPQCVVRYALNREIVCAAHNGIRVGAIVDVSIGIGNSLRNCAFATTGVGGANEQVG